MMKFIDALDLFRSQLIKYLPHFSMMSTKTYIDISSLERQIEWTAPADGYVVTKDDKFQWNCSASYTPAFIGIRFYYCNGTVNI